MIVRFINKLLGKKESSRQQQTQEPAPAKNKTGQSHKASHSLTQDTDQRKTKSRNSGKRPSKQGHQADEKNHHTAAKSTAKKKSEDLHKSWDPASFKVEKIEDKTRFHDFDLPSELMHAIADAGFQYCSPIQARSLPYALQGRDVVGKAQTGTGKTAAFLIAIIDYLMKSPLTEKPYAGEARALIIAPTRELVMQIADDAKLLCQYTHLQIHTLVGGMDYAKQQRHLHNAVVDILVATPGRLLDFCGNKDVHLDQLEILVIDEADRMLDMGFIPQVRQIVRQTPPREERQTLFFSATFTDDVHNLVEQWTYKPVTVEIEPETVANAKVEQHVYLVSTEEKYTLLYNLIQQEHADSMIIFANRRDECRDLQEKLRAHGVNAGLLSGEINQQKRVSTLEAFKSGDLKVLVATDVAGRGIHISGISHVVNFTLPEEPEDYVHRIGRTGRAGKSGTSISFACEDDALRLEPIEKLLGKNLKCEQPPEYLLLAPPDLPADFQPGSRQPTGGSRHLGKGRNRHPKR